MLTLITGYNNPTDFGSVFMQQNSGTILLEVGLTLIGDSVDSGIIKTAP